MVRIIYRWRLALALALAVVMIGLGRTGSFVAGGADSYGYISEARLWLNGSLHVRQDVMQAAPWPDAAWTFTPLGYQASHDPFHIVPVHAPGLPLLLAAAALAGGWCAAFWVVPLFGGLLVLSTYAIGARLGRPFVGLAAALLVATSPAVLFMLLQPMSDLPAAAAFTAAVALVLGGGRAAAFAAGLAAAAGILIRPNLVPLVGPFVLYTLHRDATVMPRRWRRFVTPYFAMAVSAGVVVEALINRSLYGSPIRSGYGALNYDPSHVAPNLVAYAGWLQSTQSPVVLLGLAALLVPSIALWRTEAARRSLWFLALFVLAVIVPFLFYSVNEAWWYLRYVLPIWPVMMIGTAACAALIFRDGRLWARLAGVLIIVALGWRGWSDAGRLGVFDTRAAEQKYIDAARLVAEEVDSNAAVLTVQHSGSVRHYAGRMTLRWDMFRPGTLDAAIDWLDAVGHRPYLLVEPWETDLLRERYGESDAAGRLDWPPIATLDASSTLHLYDLAKGREHPDDTRAVVTRGVPVGDQCLPPAAPLPFHW